MIKLTGITLQGSGAPIQKWELYVNPRQILTFTRESRKTKIVMTGNVLFHVMETPSQIMAKLRPKRPAPPGSRPGGAPRKLPSIPG
ncbi:MAG: hypothetical protein ISR65_00005 [Bacteriovoracaceae bacterium]|nr:hypothetical protein [Bacteriovoracaceae bacterium]